MSYEWNGNQKKTIPNFRTDSDFDIFVIGKLFCLS